MQEKKYILWDHDGVLVDTEPWYYRATKSALAEIGIDVQLDEYLAFMARGQSLWDLAAKAGVAELDIHRHKRDRNASYQHHLVSEDIEIPGVVDLLEELAKGYAMAIVTTAKKDDFELIHRSRDIVRHMEFVLMSGDYARSKPAPDPYLAALDKFAITPDRAVVIEDSQRGLCSAVAAGIDCIVVHNDFTATQDFSAATHIIDTIAELPSLLQERS